MREIAEQENLSTSYVIRYFRLAFLAPDIVEAIVEGRQPPGISVRKLTNNKKLPSDWAEQRRLLNFPAP
jgi:site-specific DNA recombinase